MINPISKNGISSDLTFITKYANMLLNVQIVKKRKL